MKIVWVLALALCRSVYFIYSLCCFFVPFLVIYSWIFFFDQKLPAPETIIISSSRFLFFTMITMAIVIPAGVYFLKKSNDPNPFQSAFMSWFGTLRWYWNSTPGPMAKIGLPSAYLVENPKNYRLTAKDMREILDKIRPGDILLRAYDGYMDGAFIRHSSVCSKNGYRPGWFTHAALYAGTLNSEDRTYVPEKFQHDKQFFQEGSQMIVHAMAKGVHTEDILTWFRCDYMVVLRIKPVTGNPYAVDPIQATTDMGTDEIIQNAKRSALRKIGEPYDFECIETNKFSRFSCAEFVYYCYRNINAALGLSPQLHALYPFGSLSRHFSIMGRMTITPDDFYSLTSQGKLEVVWIDENSKKEL